MTEQRLDEHTILLMPTPAALAVPVLPNGPVYGRDGPCAFTTGNSAFTLPQRKELDRGYYRRTFGR